MSSGRGADDMSPSRGADDMSSGRDVDDMSSSRGVDDMSSGRVQMTCHPDRNGYILCIHYVQWSLTCSFLTDNADVIHMSSLVLFIYPIMYNLVSAHVDNVCLCRQYAETKLYITGYTKSTRDDIWMTSALSVRNEYIKDYCR